VKAVRRRDDGACARSRTGRTKTGQLWAYARDDRPWSGADPPGVAYIYAPDRKAERPLAHLSGFSGVLQVDGYAGYRALAEKGGVALAFCWSHVRRRFYELAAAGPAPIASEALERIASLYAIEKDIRGRSADERRAVRRENSRPILDGLEMWLREKLDCVSKKSKLAEAIRYALSRWDGLCRFIADGRVEIDSNVVERSIRPIALNRKNALFAGSDGGGEHWAVVASLIETCKLCGVEPFAYLADVITRIVNGHPNSQIDDLLPWAYAPAQQLKDVA
jgi:transposase